jgi:hypothetical protein
METHAVSRAVKALSWGACCAVLCCRRMRAAWKLYEEHNMPLLRMEKPNLKVSQYRCVGQWPGCPVPIATPRQLFCDRKGSSGGQASPWKLSWACLGVEAVQFVVFLSRQHMTSFAEALTAAFGRAALCMCTCMCRCMCF